MYMFNLIFININFKLEEMSMKNKKNKILCC